jgi:AcrR family transcriptional regulator
MKDQTRQALIEAARTLFITKGYDGTTMIDVAEQADKGRRTLYYYFSSKKALLRAVAETELERIIDVLDAVVEKDTPASDKMVEFVMSRLNNVRHSIFRNGSLRADFTRFMRTIDSIRAKCEKREIALIERILLQGVHEGQFHVENIHIMAQFIHYSAKGLENPYIRGEIASGNDVQLLHRMARKVILGALR